MPSAGAQAQGDGNSNNNNNNNKKAGGTQPLAGAPSAAATTAGGGRGVPRGNKRPRQPSNIDDGSMKCPVHNSTHHSTLKCWEIKKLMEQFHKKMQQQSQDGAPSCQRAGKQKVDPQEEKEEEMEFQDAKRALKAIYGHSDSESSDNECHKVLHVMFGGSWAITSKRVIKTLR
jgi:hypothetical protein